MAKNEIVTFYDILDRHGALHRGINYSGGFGERVIVMDGGKCGSGFNREIAGEIVYQGEKAGRAVYEKFGRYLQGLRDAETMQVYEKLDKGHWIDRGVFRLVGIKKVSDAETALYSYILSAVFREGSEAKRGAANMDSKLQAAAWKRDKGRCAACTSVENLRFCYVNPRKKAAADNPENVEVLCLKCQLRKAGETEQD